MVILVDHLCTSESRVLFTSLVDDSRSNAYGSTVEFLCIAIFKAHQLGQTASYLTRCLVTAVVVIWLIVFAPLTCSYHGFLLRPGAVPAMAAMPMGNMGMGGAHMHHDSVYRDTVPSHAVVSSRPWPVTIPPKARRPCCRC